MCLEKHIAEEIALNTRITNRSGWTEGIVNRPPVTKKESKTVIGEQAL